MVKGLSCQLCLVALGLLPGITSRLTQGTKTSSLAVRKEEEGSGTETSDVTAVCLDSGGSTAQLLALVLRKT